MCNWNLIPKWYNGQSHMMGLIKIWLVCTLENAEWEDDDLAVAGCQFVLNYPKTFSMEMAADEGVDEEPFENVMQN